MGARAFIVVSKGKKQARQGKQAQNWLVWIISESSGVKGLSIAVSYPTLSWLGQVDGGPECESTKFSPFIFVWDNDQCRNAPPWVCFSPLPTLLLFLHFCCIEIALSIKKSVCKFWFKLFSWMLKLRQLEVFLENRISGWDFGILLSTHVRATGTLMPG